MEQKSLLDRIAAHNTLVTRKLAAAKSGQITNLTDLMISREEILQDTDALERVAAKYLDGKDFS